MFCNRTGRKRHGSLGRSDRRAFTLIEVMVVVVIIGLLAGAVTLKVKQYMDTAKVNRAESDISTLVSAVEASLTTNGEYPSNSEGLSKLDVNIRRDPWGNEYQYNNPGKNKEPFEVFSFGADGEPGGEGLDADIYSWQIGREEE
jgi:general secretion pathway protein G